MDDERVQKLLKSGMSWEEMWLEFDKEKFEGNADFLALLEYIKNNNLEFSNTIKKVI